MVDIEVLIFVSSIDVAEAVVVEVVVSGAAVRNLTSDLIPFLPLYVAHIIIDMALSKSLVQ